VQPEKQNKTTDEKHTTNKSDKDRKLNIEVNLEHTNLTQTQKDKVYKLFEKWQTIIPKTSLELGHATEVKHKIELIDNIHFKEPCRRVPPVLYNEVQEHLKEMLKVGAIRESKSPYSSNVVIVRKMDGTMRLYLDMRNLNKRTKKDAFAILRIKETLNHLAGSKYISKLDLKAGYWQVEIEESDKENTAFQVGGGLGFFECNRMPFGCCNAPATFQRQMERSMGDLNLKDCLIYLDDLIIFSKDVDSHIQKLESVFQRLSEYNLKIKPSKYEFFKENILYLGHIISSEGI